MRNRCLQSCLLMLFVSVWFVGCGGGNDNWSKDRPQTSEVQGKVTLDGAPVEGATVSFSSVGEKSIGAVGMTDSAGEFSLRTYEPGDGAVPGKHKVTVIKAKSEGGDPSYYDVNSPNYGKEVPPEAEPKTVYIVPEKYGNFETSGLEVEVTADGPNEITLELKSE